MTAVDAAQPLGRWRTFADAVALALGINLWVSLVLLPGMVSGALSSGGAQMAALLPVAVLAFGVWKRSEIVLLFGVNQNWDRMQQEFEIELEHRIILSPFAAKRLSDLLAKLIKEYETRYGELK